MLDVGFSEILLTSAIALIVLGPEKLPKVARQVGNWMGRARAMARQLTEQLEREVSAEELLKSAKQADDPGHPERADAIAPHAFATPSTADGPGRLIRAAGSAARRRPKRRPASAYRRRSRRTAAAMHRQPSPRRYQTVP